MSIAYVNTNALLPRTALLLAVVTLVLVAAGLFSLVSGPSFTVVLVAVCVGVLLCNVPKAPSRVTVCLVRVLLRVGGFAQTAWVAFVGDPYRPFAYVLILSVAVLLVIACTGTGILPSPSGPRGGPILTAENTLAIRILGTFIPFVFAAATFAKSQVAQRVPALIAQTALGGANACVWGFLVVVFGGALAMPLVGMQGEPAAVMQVSLLAVSFATVVAFVACALHVANARILVQSFRKASERRLCRLFSRYTPLPHVPGAWLHALVEVNVTGLYGRSLEQLLGPVTVAKECSDEAIRVAETLVDMAKRGIRNDSVSETSFALDELAAYASFYFRLRQRHLDASDVFNHYLAAEAGKLVESCATKEKEKFLDTMCRTVRTIGLSACQYTGIGANADGNGLLIPWEEMIEKTVVATSALENTAYANDGIGVLGQLGAEALRRGHINTVEFGLFRRLRRMGKAFAGSKWEWHNVMVNRTLGALNQMLLTYAHELPRQGFCREHFLDDSWPETVREIVKAKLDNYAQNIPWQPFAPIASPMDQPLHLLTCYREALQQVGPKGVGVMQGSLRQWRHPCTPEHARSTLSRMREQLVVVHEPFTLLLGSTAILTDSMAWSDLSSSLACLFWLDLCATCDEVGVTEDWTKSTLRQYRAAFSHMTKAMLATHGKENREPFWLDGLSQLAAIPALGLAFRSEGSATLVDGVTHAYGEMLLSLYHGHESRTEESRPTGRVGSHMLLLSAWLSSTERAHPIRGKLEAALAVDPIVVRRSWLAAGGKSQAYPSSPGLDGEWYLFPSCFWANRVQDEVQARLMNPDALEQYAGEYVHWAEEEEIPRSLGLPLDPLSPPPEGSTEAPC